MKIQHIMLSFFATLLVVSTTNYVSANALPTREGPIPRTTNGVPHLQLGLEPVPEISDDLLRRVADIPGIRIRNTILSLPGAQGFWIEDDIRLVHPEIIVRGREFAHVHPDGSLHASLPPDLVDAAIEAGWAVSHPWSHRPGWESFVMIFTPTNPEELDVVLELVERSFEYITGRGSTNG